jgi:hypothetical protein
MSDDKARYPILNDIGCRCLDCVKRRTEAHEGWPPICEQCGTRYTVIDRRYNRPTPPCWAPSCHCHSPEEVEFELPGQGTFGHWPNLNPLYPRGKRAKKTRRH